MLVRFQILQMWWVVLGVDVPESASLRCNKCKERVAKTVDGTSRLYARGAVIVKAAGVEIRCRCGNTVDVTPIFKDRHFIRMPKLATRG